MDADRVRRTGASRERAKGRSKLRQQPPHKMPTMEPRKLRVGQPITPDEFDELSDEQLARLVPRAYREFFPGKDFCADGSFYLHDGTAWSFYKAGFLDD